MKAHQDSSSKPKADTETVQTDRRKFIKTTSQVLLGSSLLGLPEAIGAPSPGRRRTRLAPGDGVVLITGTSSGFGFRMALTFARAGYTTYATMRAPSSGNARPAQELRTQAANQNLRLHVEELDVTNSEQMTRLVQAIIQREGRLDVLVNNAGIIAYAPVEVLPKEVWQLQMQTNVFGPMELAGLVLPQMRAQGTGLIIQVSSRVGRVIVPGLGLYSASKFALECATEAAHYEATPQGIDFAIIQPTAFGTEVNRNARRIFQEFTGPLITRHRPNSGQYHIEFLRKLNRDFSGTPTRDPQEVADLALRIAQTPRSQRVLRYPVGDEGELSAVKQINTVTARLQADALQRSGYGGWYRD